ncbi:MAG: VOC family protein [Gammaproteobacteria bacterium]
MSGFDLAYVAVAVKDVGGVAGTFIDDLHLDHATTVTPLGRPVPVFKLGRSAVALFALDDPYLHDSAYSEPSVPGVHHIALAAADPRAEATAVGLITAENGVRPGINEASELAIDAAATASVRLRFCEAPQFSFTASTSGPAMVERIDHIGVASRDNGAAAAVFNRGLGCPVESTQTDLELSIALESFTSDKYGVLYHSRDPEPVAGLRVSFITVGDCELEFLQPFDATGAGASTRANTGAAPSGDAHRPDAGQPGTTRSDKGAIGRYIERRGPGLHHLALKTPDIDAALKHLVQCGHEVIDPVGRSGSRRARIGFVHPRSFGGLLMHFVERDA